MEAKKTRISQLEESISQLNIEIDDLKIRAEIEEKDIKKKHRNDVEQREKTLKRHRKQVKKKELGLVGKYVTAEKAWVELQDSLLAKLERKFNVEASKTTVSIIFVFLLLYMRFKKS